LCLWHGDQNRIGDPNNFWRTVLHYQTSSRSIKLPLSGVECARERTNVRRNVCVVSLVIQRLLVIRHFWSLDSNSPRRTSADGNLRREYVLSTTRLNTKTPPLITQRGWNVVSVLNERIYRITIELLSFDEKKLKFLRKIARRYPTV
jgi:hypothetical protein